jgi:iron(III) transport system ATP-binding protein
MSFLKVDKLYNGSEGSYALNGVNFEIDKSTKLAIAGETGSGKSTLLKTIAGLVQPDSGSVVFKGKVVEGPEQKLVPGHPQIAYLSQQFDLPKSLRVEQVLVYNNKLLENSFSHVIDVCAISHLLRRKTNALSGGEQQRVALARLLVGAPELLLLDEPFSNLDVTHKQILKEVLENVSHELDISLIQVSHDPADILPWADEIILLKEGRVVQRGESQTIYYKPLDAYVAGLFGAFNAIQADEAKVIFGLTEIDSFQMLFLRPDQIFIHDQRGYPAKILSSRFYGRYREIEVAAGKTILKIQTASHYHIGEVVQIALADQSPWFMAKAEG